MYVYKCVTKTMNQSQADQPKAIIKRDLQFNSG